MILRVPRDASHTTIRSAYKSRSLALHPDKNPSAPPAAFAETQAAYTAIRTPAARAAHDASTRAVYTANRVDDPFRDDAVRRAFATQIAAQLGEEEGDMFESLFGETRAAMGSGGSASGTASGATNGTSSRDVAAADTGDDDHPIVEKHLAPWKPPDVDVDLHVSLDDLFGGCTKRRRLRKKVKDSATGTYIDGSEVLDIVLHPGYRPGDRVRFPEAGDHAAGTIPPDVVFVIVVRPHTRFALLENGDLKVPVHVSLADALAGALVRIPTLGDGDAFSVRTTDIITPGQIRRVKGRGMPSPDPDHPPADLLISFVVDFPKSLPPKHKSALRTLLSPVPASEPDFRRLSKSFASPKRSRSALPPAQNTFPRGASEKTHPKNRTSSLAHDAAPTALSLKSFTSQASLRRSRSRASAARASFHDTGLTAPSSPPTSSGTGWTWSRTASRRAHSRALSRQGTFDNRRQGKPVLPQTDSDSGSDRDSVDADRTAPPSPAHQASFTSFVAPSQEQNADQQEHENRTVLTEKPKPPRKKGWLTGWMGL